MEIFSGHQALFRPLASPCIALGNFDGVHLGHQALLHQTRNMAGSDDAVVLTFDPHPAALFAPAHIPPLITTINRRFELLEASGISVCILEPFTQDLAKLTPSQFARDILVGALGAKGLVVGHDFTYGHNRAGNAETLQDFGAAMNIAVSIVAPVHVGDVRVSSTQIRNIVSQGDVSKAIPLLGRPFEIDGTVVRGAGRGRTIGIPTANITPATQLSPAAGVYAVRVQDLSAHKHQGWLGVANLGKAPTFVKSGETKLEIHLLDFDGDLYDHQLRVAFVEHLRPERRFAGPEALVTQIRRDIDNARSILAGFR